MLWELILGLLLSFPPTGAAIAALTPAPPVAVVDSAVVEAFSPYRTPFRVRFGESESELRVLAMFVLPSETVPVSVAGFRVFGKERFELVASAGSVLDAGVDRWFWTAPSRAGVYPVEVRDLSSGLTMTLNVFVMVPSSVMRNGRLNGYPIGRYPERRTGFEDADAPPAGFVQVTPGMENVRVSPHFTLGQFVCKQEGSPRYLVLRPALIVKLEAMLAAINRRGSHARTFEIVSAYRTPFYNAAIGSVAKFSRHQYGDAADILVDENGDGRMDDLNGDGRYDLADARVLQNIADDMNRRFGLGTLLGGFGTYGHGGFVHVDVRGYDVRWDG